MLGAPPIVGNKGTLPNVGYLVTSSEHATSLTDSLGLSYIWLYTALNVARTGAGTARLFCTPGVEDLGGIKSLHGCGTERAIWAKKSARINVAGKIILKDKNWKGHWVKSDTDLKEKYAHLICKLGC